MPNLNTITTIKVIMQWCDSEKLETIKTTQ
jgi:hypothetical protein